MGRYFGTDGIRGRANVEPMTAETALKVGMAAGSRFLNGDYRHRVVIGKDTRLSGYLLEPALTAGFISVGMDVVLVGPMPTPGVAMLTRSLRADLGVMISASHNPYYDNGIKLFSPDGFKLSDEVENDIEALMTGAVPITTAPSDRLGQARRLDDAPGRYIEFVKNTFPRGLTLEGLTVVVDCAHGAAYRVAPMIFRELGATVFAIGTAPDGFNINAGCGSTAPDALEAAVIEHRADLGIALDGDADRLAMVDERGALLDGDQLMALIAAFWQRTGKLVGGGIVATVMSNLGLERYLNGLGLALARTPVGDRYVVEHMRKHGFNIGGEQSGHMVLTDFATTGDGLIAALQVLAVLVERREPLSIVGRVFPPLPQVLKNVRIAAGARGSVLDAAAVRGALTAGEARLGASGRILLRASGTEPLIRVMAECEDRRLMDAVVADIVAAVEQAAGPAAAAE
ncbi:MAG: phosphoglucosamine mutase [Alphaproteobacteria bacterium]|nr:phosphoglucosamine mutase [Alphaproteobacteria bacterium]